MLGILLIDKPSGCTSHDVVNRLRRKFGTKRVGHAGTLDPLATGLLVVAIGPATRFLQYLPLEPKTYEGEITFGRATSTYDGEGETVSEADPPKDLEEQLEATLPQFRGLIQQLPPMHSAVKVGGKPLYKYARSGQEAEREARTVHIDTFELLSVKGTSARVRVICSGGTYIRSLAHDVGQTVGCGAFLSNLQRTAVGKFYLDTARSLDEVDEKDIIPLSEALPPMRLVFLQGPQIKAIREGRPLMTTMTYQEPYVALVDDCGSVFSIARAHGNLLQPECVIPSEALDGTL